MTSQIFKDPNILNLLEWPIIEKQVQSFAHFDYTAANRIFVFKNQNEIKKIFSATLSLMDLFHNESFQETITSLHNLDSSEIISTLLSRLEKSAFLSLNDLNEVAILIEFYLNNYSVLFDLNFIQDDKDSFQNIKRLYLKNFLKEFRSFVNQDGDIDYFKHPLLRDLYRKQNDLENQIRKTLNSIGNDSDFSNRLQFNGFDIINDRYTVAVRSDSYQSHLGQIISRSDTGHTLFIEPIKIKNLNFSRLEIILELHKQIETLSIRFSKALSEEVSHLHLIKNSCFILDELNTRGQYAYRNNLSMPILHPQPIMKIKKMFHPLISNPIQNDVELFNSSKGLIISGPNTGGKTAALKTLTLVQLFARFGLFVPASEAEIHLYEEIFYFGNDGQNLPEGLSSFAAEVGNYTDLFENLGKTNLIVIDEIFNTTSSEEASALAISLFNQINTHSNSHLLVSTHHQMLKTFIHGDERYLSAHVGFNPETSRPTYKLFYGSPGGSQALKIFSLLTEKNEINNSIYNDAIKILDKKMVSYETLLEKIADKEHELSSLLKDNNELNLQLKNQKASMEGVYKLKLDEKLIKVDKDLSTILDKAQNFYFNVKKGNITSKRNFEKSQSEIKSLLSTLKPEDVEKLDNENKYKHLKSPASIIIGESYFSTFLGHTVKVKSTNLKKKEALVSRGLMTIKCPIDSLKLTGATNSNQVYVNITKSNTAKIEYDCRGMRLSEFESLVEFAVSDLLSNAIPFVNFIHGHGNGTLKKWIRSYIKNNSNIKEESNESGNDGETKIVLI